MAALNLYVDSALTTLATLPLVFTQDDAGVNPPHQRQFYLGSTDATGTVFEAASSPGLDQIVLSIADAAPGSGQPASAIKLATTSGGLASATGGASLNLGTSINSGVAGAKIVWVQFDDSTGTAATDNNISLAMNTLEVTLP